MTNKLYYVLYEDEDGNEESIEVLAPTEEIARALMRPNIVIDVIELPENLDSEEEWDWS